jgi:membrane protein
VRELARRVWADVDRDEILDRAAGLAYYFLFALFPTLLFLTALLGLLPVPDVMDHLLHYASRLLPGDAASLVSRTMGEVVRGASGGLLSVGVLAALWAASNGMSAIAAALNVALQVQDERPWWRRRLMALGLTVGFSAFTLVALLLLVFGERLGEIVAAWIGLGWAFTLVWNLLRWPVAILCVQTGISLVYALAPAARRRWRLASPGSLLALVGWLVMSFGLRVYVTYVADYNTTYGSIGGVILLMLWFYLTAVVLLVGAEVNSEIERARRVAARSGAPD